MTVYYVKQGDTAPVATATLLDPSGAAVSLSGAVVRFHMSNATTVIVDALATVDADQVLNKGKVTYQWLTANTATAGTFRAEWQVTFADATIQTFPNFGYDTVQIETQLA
jgi:hypothetical protein